MNRCMYTAQGELQCKEGFEEQSKKCICPTGYVDINGSLLSKNKCFTTSIANQMTKYALCEEDKFNKKTNNCFHHFGKNKSGENNVKSWTDIETNMNKNSTSGTCKK